MLRLAPVVAALVLCSGAAATSGASRWCRAPTPASWKRTLVKSVVSLSRHVSMQPTVGAGDGRTFFAELYTPGFSGVVRIDARSGHVTRIRAFPNARNDQADGSFGGRWFVWNEYHSLEDFNDFTVFAWDARTRRVTQIGAARHDAQGGFWPSGWRQPDVRGSFATWTQGTGPNGEGEVHVYDLARGVDRVVRRGHPQGSFFVAGPKVVWSESLVRGQETQFLAADPRTGGSVGTPQALTGLRGVSALFTDGRVIAYPTAKFKALWWAPSLAARPAFVFKPKPGYHYLDNSVRVGGRYFLFSSEGHYYVADGRARRYMDLGAGNDGVAVDKRALVVVHWAPGKRLHPKGVESFVPLRSLPRLSRCA
jgi:hypothetical protein